MHPLLDSIGMSGVLLAVLLLTRFGRWIQSGWVASPSHRSLEWSLSGIVLEVLCFWGATFCGLGLGRSIRFWELHVLASLPLLHFLR
jgi:hypothetical protein